MSDQVVPHKGMSTLKKVLIGATVAVLLFLGGCAALVVGFAAGESPSVQNSTSDNRPNPVASNQAKPESLAAKFGQTYQYTNGLEVTVSQPTPFTPSEYTEITNNPVKFTVTFLNKSERRLDGGGELINVRSSDVEAESIYDSETLGETPSTVLLPGDKATFNVGFDVVDPSSLVLEVTPSVFTYESVVFTS